jgi:hypothetical protein
MSRMDRVNDMLLWGRHLQENIARDEEGAARQQHCIQLTYRDLDLVICCRFNQIVAQAQVVQIKLAIKVLCEECFLGTQTNPKRSHNDDMGTVSHPKLGIGWT